MGRIHVTKFQIHDSLQELLTRLPTFLHGETCHWAIRESDVISESGYYILGKLPSGSILKVIPYSSEYELEVWPPPAQAESVKENLEKSIAAELIELLGITNADEVEA